jgi:hypothetical protein
MHNFEDSLTTLKSAIDYYFNIKNLYCQLKEENERLKAENKKLQAINLSAEMTEAYFCLHVEHEKLKADNEQLKTQLQQPDPSLRAELSSLLGCDNENKAVYSVVSKLKNENDCLLSEIRFLKTCLAVNNSKDKLDKKIEELKETFQKAEPKHKPHKCPVCDGKSETIYNDSGSISTDFHTLLSRLSRINDAGQMFLKCKNCNGTGIVWSR